MEGEIKTKERYVIRVATTLNVNVHDLTAFQFQPHY